MKPWNPPSADLLSVDGNRKVLYREDHTPKPFASDERKYFHERVKVLHEKLQEASNKLATTLKNLKRKLKSHIGKDRQSGRKKENKRKVKKLKEKRLQQRAHLLLEKLTSREVAGEVFDAIKTNNSFNKYRNHQCWVNRKIGQSSSSQSTLCYGYLKKAFLIKTLPVPCR